jgi:hypothetical protein
VIPGAADGLQSFFRELKRLADLEATIPEDDLDIQFKRDGFLR